MQFGQALEHILICIRHADPKYGPVYISKQDISDGFCRVPLDADGALLLAVLLPMAPGEPLLIGILWACPWGGLTPHQSSVPLPKLLPMLLMTAWLYPMSLAIHWRGSLQHLPSHHCLALCLPSATSMCGADPTDQTNACVCPSPVIPDNFACYQATISLCSMFPISNARGFGGVCHHLPPTGTSALCHNVSSSPSIELH